MSVRARLIETVETRDTLGEGVLWRDSDRTVWWTDIEGRRCHRLAWPSLQLDTYRTPERLGSFGFVAGRDDLLLAAFESGFALYAPATGRLAWLYRPAALGPGLRLNDGRVDPAGRFWAGSMLEGPARQAAQPRGTMYRIGADGCGAAVFEGLRIANGLCWSPAGDRMYFADSALGEVYAAPFDAGSGTPGQREVLARFDDGAPDGAVTDADGGLWLALWGGGCILRLSRRGDELARIDVEAPQPTCPAFGGPNGNLLFVVSARAGLGEDALEASPLSGALFVFETGVRGGSTPRARLQDSVLRRAGMEVA